MLFWEHDQFHFRFLSSYGQTIILQDLLEIAVFHKVHHTRSSSDSCYLCVIVLERRERGIGNNQIIMQLVWVFCTYPAIFPVFSQAAISNFPVPSGFIRLLRLCWWSLLRSMILLEIRSRLRKRLMIPLHELPCRFVRVLVKETGSLTRIVVRKSVGRMLALLLLVQLRILLLLVGTLLGMLRTIRKTHSFHVTS